MKRFDWIPGFPALVLAVALAGAHATPASAQTYAPTWESIDSRPTPQWWSDAKFGIFIHWGVYSVPAFAPKGEYAEWYWEWLAAPGDAASATDQEIRRQTREFHARLYGKGFQYPDFAPQFRAEMFDAEQWAEILENSGAKYVVLTSKHHDGFALWPSREADASWGRPWNAVGVGPKRDLVGEISAAVRKRGLEMGFYFSLYEWFSPLWLSGDVKAYVEKHLFPQFKDLVTRYSPSVIFSDGEWSLDSQQWRAPELLAWLFNESAVGGKVVINDRWGGESRHRHGGYYTTEYGAGLPGASHAWEENRGIGHSYGYNRNEDLADYATGQRLLLTLLDTVSRGGNLLLNIGPTADGRIPVEMQGRLAFLGAWLKRNGEAVYGTRTFRDGAQWTTGRRPKLDTSTNVGATYDVETMTLNPAAGDARKEVLFTRKGETLFAILPRYPRGEFRLRDLRLRANARVSLIGEAQPISWTQRGRDVVIMAPPLGEEGLTIGPRVFRLEGIVD